MTTPLFVYGTLAPGRSNAGELADLAGRWEPASVRGRLFPDGWGAAVPFPALVLDADGPAVAGQLFTSDELPAHWARLDAFEGAAYRRVPCTATRSDGSTLRAFVYELDPDHPDTPPPP